MNTRFNPTCNGLLHLGHAYVALVNEHEALTHNGVFILRLDDNQSQWVERLGRVQMTAFGQAAVEDLQWLGLSFVAHSQRLDDALMRGELARQGFAEPESFAGAFPSVIGVKADPYPYHPYFTAEKVIYDHAQQISPVIRGDDLRDEYTLYCYLWERFGYGTPPQHVYLPRLLEPAGELDDVSKTRGTYKIRTLREQGMTAEEVIHVLRMSCLVDPSGPWDWRNVKAQPRLEL